MEQSILGYGVMFSLFVWRDRVVGGANRQRMEFWDDPRHRDRDCRGDAWRMGGRNAWTIQ